MEETKKCIDCGKEIKQRTLCESCRAKQYRKQMQNSVCKVSDCNNVVKAKGMCNTHLKEHNSRLRGDYCPKCGKLVFSRGLCEYHYRRKYVNTIIRDIT
jgi:hypothetical protein